MILMNREYYLRKMQTISTDVSKSKFEPNAKYNTFSIQTNIVLKELFKGRSKDGEACRLINQLIPKFRNLTVSLNPIGVSPQMTAFMRVSYNWFYVSRYAPVGIFSDIIIRALAYKPNVDVFKIIILNFLKNS